MPPKKQTTSSKKTNITRPTSGGVKKRGEPTAYKPRTKISQSLPTRGRSNLVDGWSTDVQVRYASIRDAEIRKLLARTSKELYDFMHVHNLYNVSIQKQARLLTITREIKELRRLLHDLFYAICQSDRRAIRPPVLAFHHETRGKKAYTPLTVKEVKEYINLDIDLKRKIYQQNLKPGGLNWNKNKRDGGFEENFVVPFYMLKVLLELGYAETLTPLQRDLFMAHFNWVKRNTTPTLKKYMGGTLYDNANIAKIKGVRYTPDFFAAPSSTAPHRKRTR